MKLLAAAALLTALSATAAMSREDDAFLWLEGVDDPKAIAWAEAENVKTAEVLETDARYAPMLAEARAIFTAQDRIPTPQFRAGGIDNLWQDAQHPHGLWRHASEASFRSPNPSWDTLIDVDALAGAENRKWFFKGAICLKPEETTCLVRLSDGGGDAVEIREFDTRTRRFVNGGFRFAEGKQYVQWLDRDTLAVAREWTPGEVTSSGYPFVVKLVTRDGSAREVFRGAKSDMSAAASVLRGRNGGADGIIVSRNITFYEREFSLLNADGGLVRIPLPRKAEQEAYLNGQLVFSLQESWGGFEPGTLISYDLADLKADAAAAKARLVFRPGPRQAVQQVAATDNRLVVILLEDVKGAVDTYAFDGQAWRMKRLPLPGNANINLVDAAGADDELFITVESFLEPTSLWLADAASGAVAKVKSLPPRFDAATHVVEQFWATSSDGAKIPYFVVRPKAAKLDGSLPTLMYGYGGFQLAKPPIYMPEAGKLWMERGGAYVIANIRGGGEFGPAWHQAVLRDKRQLAFDDFAAVARDLADRKITSPRRLGIYGRSNGGVLTTVSMTQHPELWNAVVVESPLIDMLRYHKLSAGASWIGEYGNPDIPEDHAFISRYSGYQALKPGVNYPLAYITTNTRDDRVHPGHARKFAARLQQLGVPYLYYEQTFGGHANDADPELNARRWARHYVYLAQRLMD